jgi:hypothetical protein
MPQPQRISFSPNPPVQGESVEICYDFTGLSITSTTLVVTFSPGGSPTSYSVSTEIPCFTITVPGSATSFLIHDSSKNSPDNGSMIVKPM